MSAQQIPDQELLIGALRAEKPGQEGVRAPDGFKYSAGQVQWLKGRQHALERACREGDESLAAALEVNIIRTLHSNKAAHRAR